MPEMPEVEVFRRRVEEGALHRTVETVGVPSRALLVDTSPSSLRDAFLGHRMVETLRHGKHLFVRSGEERRRWLRLHFGMTGSVRVYPRGAARAPDHVHLRFDLQGGASLAYRCTRKLGEIGLVEDPERFVSGKGLGPDVAGGGVGGPLDAEGFRGALAGHAGMLKPTLMNQEILAGLGNDYVDEALFQAGLHPGIAVDALSDHDLDDLRDTIASILATAVDADARREDLPDDWLLRRREEGAPCPRCDGTIVKTRISGRATYLCDHHQPEP